MRRGLSVVIGLVLGASVVSAEEYELRSRIHDFTPGDGIMDAGTAMNPWEIEANGRPVAEVRPRTTDFVPGDGFLDAGSASNPWVVETRD